MELVRERGIDLVQEYRDILSFVIGKVEPNKNSRESEFLQTVRLVKRYGFIK